MGHVQFYPPLQSVGDPSWQELCSQVAQLSATTNFFPRSKAPGTHVDGTNYVAGPFLFLPPCFEGWGHPRRRVLSRHALLSATCCFVPRFKVLGSPHMVGVLYPRGAFMAISDFVPCFPSVGDAVHRRGHVANPPTCWTLVLLSPAPKHWGRL